MYSVCSIACYYVYRTMPKLKSDPLLEAYWATIYRFTHAKL